MELLSFTLQAGISTDQINYYVWLQGEACYYGRSTEFTLELRFQPLDHPGDLTQILEAHLIYLLNNPWWLFSPKNFTLRLPSGGGAPQLDRCNRPTLFQVEEDPLSIKISLMMLICLLLLLIFISSLMVWLTFIFMLISIYWNITIDYPETHYLGITSSSGGRTTCGQATPRIVPSYTSGCKNCRGFHLSTFSIDVEKNWSMQIVSQSGDLPTTG